MSTAKSITILAGSSGTDGFRVVAVNHMIRLDLDDDWQ